MGFDFKCGCRRSGNNYFLCQRHENMLECEETERTECPNCHKELDEREIDWENGNCRFCIEEQKEKCICNRGIHDRYNTDCACKCHKED